jgi:undecaprenyl-diphosphatase
MNYFDKEIVEFVIKHFDRSYDFFHPIEFIADSDNLLKGGVFAILIWYMWFKGGPADSEKRVKLLTTLVSVFFVMMVTVSLAILLPFRIRPFLNPDFYFSVSGPIDPYISSLSSFPSDHAALFISLSTGFLFVSRKIGLAALLYAIFFILFPRLYLGFHYPSDLIAGSLIGISITTFFNRSVRIKKIIAERIFPVSKKYPGVFYAVLFIVTYEIADLFAGSRNILSFLHEMVKHQ